MQVCINGKIFVHSNILPTLNFSRLARIAWTGFPQNRILPAPSKTKDTKVFMTQFSPLGGTVEQKC